ncbi:MAG: AMP-binding protein, partial [Paracoccaceae bacterium]|nr:AMP-binding protein [Paracoccaceae bacterium]
MTSAGKVRSYDAAVAGFSLAEAEARLAGSLDGGLNACVECCDRHVAPGKVALNWIGKDGTERALTFAELQD